MSKERFYSLIDHNGNFELRDYESNREIHSLFELDDFLNEQAQRITDLETKLAESESRFQTHKETDAKTIQEQSDLIDQLKQQLAEKEKQEFLWLQKIDWLFEKGKNYEEIWQFVIDRIKSVNGRRYADGYQHEDKKEGK